MHTQQEGRTETQADWSEVSANQGTLRIASNQQKPGEGVEPASPQNLQEKPVLPTP